MKRTRSVAVLVAVLGACGLGVAAGPLATSAAPPDDTFELAGDPVDVTQGDVIQIDGTCWAETIGPADQARVRLSRVVPPGSGVAPFDTSVELEVGDADGSFGGGLTVPPDAPAGDYRLSGVCVFADQVRGLPTSDVTVTGEPTATTTTTSTTTQPSPGTAVPPAPAPPAVAVDGEAQLTG